VKLQSRSSEEPEVNLTSLIDVVLLLLVFFMVSTSFVRESEINIRLPEASADPVEPAEITTLEIGITETGNYLLNGRLLAASDSRTLQRGIERILGDQRDVDIVIRGDSGSDYQAAVTAMSVAGELGFTSIRLATVTTPGAE